MLVGNSLALWEGCEPLLLKLSWSGSIEGDAFIYESLLLLFYCLTLLSYLVILLLFKLPVLFVAYSHLDIALKYVIFSFLSDLIFEKFLASEFYEGQLGRLDL